MFDRSDSNLLLKIHKRLNTGNNGQLNSFATLFKWIPQQVLVENICWASISSEDREAANVLLQNVINAKWEIIEKLAQKKPPIMFMEATARDIDNKTIRTSPLKYVFQVCDRYSREIFEKIALEHNFLKQYLEEEYKIVYFDFRPFQRAYRLYLDMNEVKKANTDEALNEFNYKYHKILEKYDFLKEYWGFVPEKVLKDTDFFNRILRDCLIEVVAHAQLYLLPRHILIQMCAKTINKDFRWSISNRFDEVQRPPSECMAKYCKSYSFVDVLDFDRKSHYVLAQELALGRGDCVFGSNTAAFLDEKISETTLRDDLETINHLYETRRTQQWNRYDTLLKICSENTLNNSFNK